MTPTTTTCEGLDSEAPEFESYSRLPDAAKIAEVFTRLNRNSPYQLSVDICFLRLAILIDLALEIGRNAFVGIGFEAGLGVRGRVLASS